MLLSEIHEIQGPPGGDGQPGNMGEGGPPGQPGKLKSTDFFYRKSKQIRALPLVTF